MALKKTPDSKRNSNKPFLTTKNTRKNTNFFKGCCVEVRDRLGKFHACTFNPMWQLPSLLSPSEGIWSARVSPAPLFPFVSMWSLPSLLSPSEGIWSARVSPAPLFPFVSMWSLPSSASPPASRFAVIANKQETPIKEYPEEAHDLSGSFRKVV